jgi:hypothetical protein
MVAKITVPATIHRALNYNEQKVRERKAECIYAQNFLKEAEHLHFYEKLHRFEDLISLNKRAATNTVHISLNFALDEKIGKEQLAEIASVYMDKIGFADQPFLVYQHLDAGHPHIHIVTTNIQKNGKRISLHNLGRNESTKARKEIEIAFNLVKAEDQKRQLNDIKAISATRMTYGKSATKKGIVSVLDTVLPYYKYTSLAELNAVLKLYNLTADRGKEQGIIYNKRGLVYRVLDEKGNKIGVPIKASAIYNKPTLPYLEKRFKQNDPLKQAHKKNLKTSIDWIMVRPPNSLQAFKHALEKEKISLVIRQNDTGIIYGLTYIDHNTKCVFNGSDIGKEYSAKSILQKCGVSQSFSETVKPEWKREIILPEHTHEYQKHNLSKILDEIITPVEQSNYIPYDLRKQKKKKRKSN